MNAPKSRVASDALHFVTGLLVGLGIVATAKVGQVMADRLAADVQNPRENQHEECPDGDVLTTIVGSDGTVVFLCLPPGLFAPTSSDQAEGVAL